ncbi:MAG TPA: HD domain-containing protein [Candidatus Omnitrophota bacterium]|nr:HD domain-containing protein [Candidatus Omnitrophota bacterium]HPS36969.1 HD domain-containing protein [Candidatus Omnitrophota bacterium]
MTEKRSFLNSFRAKVTLVLVFGMFFMAFASDLILRQVALDSQFEQLRNRLTILASSVALSLDAEAIKAIPLNRAGIETPAFQKIYGILRRIKEENPSIGYIYVMARTERPDVLQFVVDPDPYLRRNEGLSAYPGDRYSTVHFPNMPQAFSVPFAEKEVGTDEWGSMLSGYAPIRDEKGNAVAILGIDLMASDILVVQKAFHERAVVVFLIGAIFSFLFGMWISFRITRSVAALGEGIRRVSRGDLEHPVELCGNDEIADLAHSFNRMTQDLRETRQKNRDYFYGIIQSLVRIVEARDPYTRGHSERVAEYAGQIAMKIGFPTETVEMLKQTAVLHDIGKLGIHEEILKKTERLTDVEWELLRNHPALGEDILRPVLLSQEMLAIVRGHHERYDGQGYPDHLAGDQINVFAQILSVADAYDAMTSTRAYRPALTQDAALEELQKNRGVQFNPGIVDVFIEILRQENSGKA